MIAYRLGRFMFRVWLKLFQRIQYHGCENVPETGGAIIVANHTSLFDPPALGCGVDRPLTYVARGTLRDHWLYRTVTRTLDIVQIDPKKGDRGALRAVTEALKAGKACVIFPEGTRSADGHLQRLKGGVLLMARQAKVPIVPAYVSGSFDAWPRQRTLPRPFRRVLVRYGPPVRIEELGDEPLVELRNRIQAQAEPWAPKAAELPEKGEVSRAN